MRPDGNSEGALGCIGVSGDAATLKRFRDNLRRVLKYQTSVPTNVNITGNPNNNEQAAGKYLM